jgi:hypothetical protein
MALSQDVGAFLDHLGHGDGWFSELSILVTVGAKVR